MQLKKLSIRPNKILWGLIGLAYPVAVFVALQRGFSVRILGLCLLCALVVMLARRKNIWMGICGLLLAASAIIFNQEIFLKLYPVFMNAIVCLVFAVSLGQVPLVQKIAEKMNYEMNEKSRRYACRVTLAWAVFMGINTCLSFVTVFMSDWIWTLYNGLISYCLIGLMFIGEYVVRLGVLNEHK